MKLHAFRSQPVERRRIDVRVAKRAEVRITVIIAEQEQNVRLVRGCERGGRAEVRNEDEGDSHGGNSEERKYGSDAVYCSFRQAALQLTGGRFRSSLTGQRVLDFITDSFVVFARQTVVQGSKCVRRANLAERPSASAADKRLGIVQPANEGRHPYGRPLVAEHNRCVAQDAASPWTPQRRVTKAAAERVVVQFK